MLFYKNENVGGRFLPEFVAKSNNFVASTHPGFIFGEMEIINKTDISL